MSNFHNVNIALTRFTFTGLAPGVSGKTEEATAIRISHKSPFPHVMSVLQDAAPRAFGTCLLNANGNLDICNQFCSLDFVQSINLGKLWLSHTVACKQKTAFMQTNVDTLCK